MEFHAVRGVLSLYFCFKTENELRTKNKTLPIDIFNVLFRFQCSNEKIGTAYVVLFSLITVFVIKSFIRLWNFARLNFRKVPKIEYFRLKLLSRLKFRQAV